MWCCGFFVLLEFFDFLKISSIWHLHKDKSAQYMARSKKQKSQTKSLKGFGAFSSSEK